MTLTPLQLLLNAIEYHRPEFRCPLPDGLEAAIQRASVSDLLAAADRRDHLCRHVPVCPACNTVQVQLVDQRNPAGWRCRVCRHAFDHEPVPF